LHVHYPRFLGQFHEAVVEDLRQPPGYYENEYAYPYPDGPIDDYGHCIAQTTHSFLIARRYCILTYFGRDKKPVIDVESTVRLLRAKTFLLYGKKRITKKRTFFLSVFS
jgi:hypothetical protein